MDRDRKADRLAYCRRVEAEYQESVLEAETELYNSDLWRWLEQQRSRLSIAEANTAAAEAALDNCPTGAE